MASASEPTQPHDSILRRLGALPYIQKVPAEIWQAIFVLALSNVGNQHPKNPYDRALRTLCHVCQSWRAAAKGQQRVWTKFPTFGFGEPSWRPSSLKKQGPTFARLDQYLVSSGSRSFTFGFILHHDRNLSSAYVSFALTVLRRLVKECHRWGGAMLYLARYDNVGRWPDDLLPIKGRLHAMSTLDLTIGAESDAEWSNLSSLFYDAPNLRHVVFNSPRRGRDTAHFDLVLPWQQLETFEGLCHTNDSLVQLHSYCRDTLLSLKVEIADGVLTSLPSSITFSSLTTLYVRFSCASEDTVARIFQLVLPCLQSLELRGDTSVTSVPLFRLAQILILNSRCRLQRLALGLRMAGSPLQSFGDLKVLLYICPLLSDFDILSSYVPFGSLARLAIDAGPPTVILGPPSLKTLTIRRGARDTAWVVPPQELIQIFPSSQNALGGPGGTKAFARLREVRFVHTAQDPDGWSSQLDLLDYCALPAFCTGGIELAVVKRWRQGLADCIGSTPNSLDEARQREVSALMNEMEECDLEIHDSRIFARRGILCLLHRISEQKAGEIQGDGIYNFCKRAAALCDKWRPRLLAEYKLSPYRWYRITDTSATLKYTLPNSDGSDDELWANILGRGQEESERGQEERWPSARFLDGFYDPRDVFGTAAVGERA